MGTMEKLSEKIYAVVRAIPPGRVSTYGRVAAMAGIPRGARAVGYALNRAPRDVPCQRVVNRLGGLSDAFLPTGRETHRLLLEMEGVGFTADGAVDLARFLWAGPGAERSGGEGT